MANRRTILVTEPSRRFTLAVPLISFRAGRWEPATENGVRFERVFNQKRNRYGEVHQWTYPTDAGTRIAFRLQDAVGLFHLHLGACLSRAFFFGAPEKRMSHEVFNPVEEV